MVEAQPCLAVAVWTAGPAVTQCCLHCRSWVFERERASEPEAVTLVGDGRLCV